MRLEGSCARIFGRTRISFANTVPGQLPVAPMTHDGLEKGICKVSLKYIYKRSSNPVVGQSVQGYRVLSSNSYGTQEKEIETVTTDRNGVARFRFTWQPSSCGVEFRIFDPRDANQANLNWPSTLLTADAFFRSESVRAHSCPRDYPGKRSATENLKTNNRVEGAGKGASTDAPPSPSQAH